MTATTSEALETLREAHRGGLERLQVLSNTVARPDFGNSETLRILTELVGFFDGELRTHFRHEEEALFPALEQAIGRDGPIAVMLAEHQSFWESIAALHRKVDELEGGAEDGARTTRLLATSVADFLRNHIAKEDMILFPIAEQELTHQKLEDVAREMRAIE
ncbi:MAG: hemerythrin domain-containing protein [Chloroflexi bacterium]|nr:hemerythrin domain-containing protein [Chloroflexota bacterium]